MKKNNILLGQAESGTTQTFLEKRFTEWKYSSIWKKKLEPERINNALLGIEFRTTDILAFNESLPQLLLMGCNHFQWVIEQPEELAFINQAPFSNYILHSPSPIVSRQGIVLSLRLDPSAAPDALFLIEQGAKKMKIDQWDRIWCPLETFEKEQDLPPNVGLSIQSTSLFGNSIPNKYSEMIERNSNIRHIQLPLQLSHFANLKPSTTQKDQINLISFIEKFNGKISLRADSTEGVIESYAPQKNSNEKIKNSQQAIETILVLLKVAEKRLNNKIKDRLNKKNELSLFNFVESLDDACKSIDRSKNWEQYISELWFPPFQHHVRNWTSNVPGSSQKQWQSIINEMMGYVHELLGLQSEALRMRHSQQLLPFTQILDQHFPEMPTIMTLEAKYLLLLSSTSWSETVFFPWTALDSAIENLGLMRVPHLENTDLILKSLSMISPSLPNKNPLSNV